MNDLERMCSEVPPPDATAVAEGRRRLLAAARGDVPRSSEGPPRTRRRRSRPLRIGLPRMGVRLVAVGTAAVAIAAGTTLAQLPHGIDDKGRPRQVIPGLPAGPVANAAELMDRAATAVESRPFTPPRPDQWIFVEHRQRFPAIGTRVNAPGVRLVTHIERTWWRADGTQVARTRKGHYGDGRLQIEDGPAGWKHHYPSLAALPTDPKALPGAMAAKGYLDGFDEQTARERAETLYLEYNAILRNGVAPPKLEGAIFRSIASLPGVTLRRNAVDVAGRPAIAVARIIDGFLHYEILVDRTTYRYMGERIIAITDHTSTGTDGTWRVKKGAILNLQTRTDSGSIVDAPGRIP
ncbi:CU044_5270 family protein [Actinomadura sp. HBU206391]|uniref:CU044_5270 family protein n=1 Tax=Actinomadura sp. HBU206391 TaxID=2731692 RepID=UPI00164EF583|nr:CU044_5270 family protein [Actinomadura sp. HBU206391]MBC6457115.1 CU044_5270 family protein [Actinomadura sp. HBU206391]